MLVKSLDHVCPCTTGTHSNGFLLWIVRRHFIEICCVHDIAILCHAVTTHAVFGSSNGYMAAFLLSLLQDVNDIVFGSRKDDSMHARGAHLGHIIDMK